MAFDWLNVIRSTPYSHSLGFHSNISNIRQWVLLQQGYCENVNRHILFDYRGRFLGYIDNESDSILTQAKLNKTRLRLHAKGRVNRWISGSEKELGYPFALNCNQPHADVYSAIRRLFGNDKKDRLWGTWDGMVIGTKDSPVPLIQLVEKVYRQKSKVIQQPLIAAEFRYFLGQIIIESGARKNSISKDRAIGLLQLKPSVLKDCRIPEKFYRHRMAQVDCAVRLFHQNRRNLYPVFENALGHLPEKKKQLIFSLLLVQSYHSGIGRVSKILSEEKTNSAIRSFAKDHERYSAQDIATGLIYHNMGRSDLGFASLYYVIDIIITADKLCEKPELQQSWICG